MAKILILIGAHLCTSPRSQKEAETLVNAGHDVTIYGCWFDSELIRRDQILMANKKWRFKPIIDLQNTRSLLSLQVRLSGRLAREKFQHFALFSPELLGYGIKAMLQAARQANSDLTIVHSEGGLWIANQLLNQGYRVGVDFEDWFSEDLPLSARKARPITKLKVLEQRLARECKYCLTTSQALAKAIAEVYQAPKPTVIYNVFPWKTREKLKISKSDRRNLNLPSLHWFSQTIGPGRGLEILFLALPYLKIPVEIHLRGNYPESARQWLEPLIPSDWRENIFIHSTVPNGELLSHIAEHDIGLALETSSIVSRNLTVTNKLFQYLQAGLAVIATDTVGQREIFSQRPAIGELIPNENPLALAQALEKLLEVPEKLAIAKAASVDVTEKIFCWEQQEKRLIQAVESALIAAIK